VRVSKSVRAAIGFRTIARLATLSSIEAFQSLPLYDETMEVLDEIYQIVNVGRSIQKHELLRVGFHEVTCELLHLIKYQLNHASKAGLIDPQRVSSRGFHAISCLMLGVIGAWFASVIYDS